MTRKPVKSLRCAIYTRKSTEHGLELEFNSLDAQREACEAYIKSQASQAGWRFPNAMTTGLFRRQRWSALPCSGFSRHRCRPDRCRRRLQDRPADPLARRLRQAGRGLRRESISFVAITQQFNTTTSMGRLTLNVLLSFAQFERELPPNVCATRSPPRARRQMDRRQRSARLRRQDKKLVINPTEAKTVRMIFPRYLALKSCQKLIDELNDKGIVTKKRLIAGRSRGGIPFTYGPLAYLLKNRTYLGETGHDGHLVRRRARADHRARDLSKTFNGSYWQRPVARGPRQQTTPCSLGGSSTTAATA